MKTIILVRHAKAAGRKLDIPDFERSLQKKGLKDAKKIAGILKLDGIQPDLFLSSPANRALETAHIFAEKLDYPIQKVIIKEVLYNETSPQKILELIHEIDDKYSTIMIFGHNPTFDDLASFLITKFNENISASGAVGIRFRNKTWRNISSGKGELLLYEYPIRKSEKNQIYENIHKPLLEKMTKQIHQWFEEIDNEATQKISDIIDQSGKKLVSKFLKSLKVHKAKRISETLSKRTIPSKKRPKNVPPAKGKKLAPKKGKATIQAKSKEIKDQKPK